MGRRKTASYLWRLHLLAASMSKWMIFFYIKRVFFFFLRLQNDELAMIAEQLFADVHLSLEEMELENIITL